MVNKVVKNILGSGIKVDVLSRNATSGSSSGSSGSSSGSKSSSSSSSGTSKSIGGGVSTSSTTARYTGGVGKSSVTFTSSGGSSSSSGGSGGGGGGGSSKTTTPTAPVTVSLGTVAVDPKTMLPSATSTYRVPASQVATTTAAKTSGLPAGVTISPTTGKISIDTSKGPVDLRSQQYQVMAAEKAVAGGYATAKQQALAQYGLSAYTSTPVSTAAKTTPSVSTQTTPDGRTIIRGLSGEILATQLVGGKVVSREGKDITPVAALTTTTTGLYTPLTTQPPKQTQPTLTPTITALTPTSESKVSQSVVDFFRKGGEQKLPQSFLPPAGITVTSPTPQIIQSKIYGTALPTTSNIFTSLLGKPSATIITPPFTRTPPSVQIPGAVPDMTPSSKPLVTTLPQNVKAELKLAEYVRTPNVSLSGQALTQAQELAQYRKDVAEAYGKVEAIPGNRWLGSFKLLQTVMGKPGEVPLTPMLGLGPTVNILKPEIKTPTQQLKETFFTKPGELVKTLRDQDVQKALSVPEPVRQAFPQVTNVIGDIYGAAKEPVITTIPGLSPTKYESKYMVGEKAAEFESRAKDLGIFDTKVGPQTIVTNLPPVAAARYLEKVGESLQLKQDLRMTDLYTKRQLAKDYYTSLKENVGVEARTKEFETLLQKYPEGYKDPITGEVLTQTIFHPEVTSSSKKNDVTTITITPAWEEKVPVAISPQLDKMGYERTRVIPKEELATVTAKGTELQALQQKYGKTLESIGYKKDASGQYTLSPVKSQTMREYQLGKLKEGKISSGEFLWGDVGTGVASTAIDVAVLNALGVTPAVGRGFQALPTAFGKAGTVAQVLGVGGLSTLAVVGGVTQARETGASFEKMGLPYWAGVAEGGTKGTAELAAGILVGTKGEASPLKFRTVEMGGVKDATTGISTGGAKYYTMSWEGMRGAKPLVTISKEGVDILKYPTFESFPKGAILDTTNLFAPSSKTEMAFYDKLLQRVQNPLDRQIVGTALKEVAPLTKVNVPGKSPVNVRATEGAQVLTKAEQDVLVSRIQEEGAQTKGFRGVYNAIMGRGPERIYGSSTIVGEGGITRQAGDVDVSYYDLAKPRAQDYARILSKASGNQFRSVEGAVEKRVGSDWVKLLDLHGSDTPELMLPAGKFGYPDLGKKVGTVEGKDVVIQKLSQSALDKIAGISGITRTETGEFVVTGLPKRGYGIKDAQDVPAILQRLVQVQSGGKVMTTPGIESLKTDLTQKFPGIKFSTPADITIKSTIQTPGQVSSGTQAVTTTGLIGTANMADKIAKGLAKLPAAPETRYQLKGFKGISTPSPTMAVTLPGTPSVTPKVMSDILGYSGPKPSGIKQTKATPASPSFEPTSKLFSIGDLPSSVSFGTSRPSLPSSRGGGSYSVSLPSSLSTSLLSISPSISPGSYSFSIGSPSPYPPSPSPSKSPGSPSPSVSPSISPSISFSTSTSAWKMPTFGGRMGGLPGLSEFEKPGRGAYSWLITNPVAPIAEEWFTRQEAKGVGALTGVTLVGMEDAFKVGSKKSSILRGKI